MTRQKQEGNGPTDQRVTMIMASGVKFILDLNSMTSITHVVNEHIHLPKTHLITSEL